MTPKLGEGLRVLILPGWLDSDDGHWQSRWQALHGFERVQQADWTWPRRGDWMARLDEVLLADDRSVVLVAHSLGCQLVAAWAAHSKHSRRVIGALLVAADWGASASGLGAIGHVNTQSGLGDWPAGLQWLQGLLQHGTSLERT